MAHAHLPLMFVLASLPAIAAASDGVITPDFSRLRAGGPSLSGPRGLPRQIDPAVEPATFHAYPDAKPIDLAAPAPALAEPPQAVEAREPAAAQPAPVAEPIEPPSSTDRENRLLGAAPDAEATPNRRSTGLPSNPLESLAAWRPSTRTLTATGAGLAITIGLLISFTWLIRSLAPKSSRPLPKDVVEVLGRVALGTKQTTQLVRVGNKLLLVAVTPEGAETLTEITDPSEVARLIAACEASSGRGQKAEFDAMLREMADERTTPGFLDGDAYGSETPGLAGGFDPRSLAAAYANTPGGRGDA